MALKRIGVIGDIHAEHTRLESALLTLSERNVELVVATGDIADGKGSVDACCALLKSHGVVTVRGNHDRWLLAGTSRDLPDATVLAELTEPARSFLQRLPPMIELSTIRGVALLCHGIGTNDMAKVGPDEFGYALETNDELQYLLRSGDCRWLINGHSHRRMVRAFPGLTIINAGTLKREHTPGFIEVDFEQGTVLAFEFQPDGAILGPTGRVGLT